MSFNATITINCWKQHKCVGCGGTYQYKFARKVSGTGNTEADASAAAEKEAVKKVEGEVDERPCPHCGCVQPDMIGQEKSQSHLGWMGIVLLPAVVLLVMAGIPSATWMPYSRAAMVLGIVVAVGVLAHWFVALANPNGNKDKNREKAAKLVDAGEMEALKPSNPDRVEGDPPAVAPGALLWLLLATASVPLVAAPVLMKAVGGWASNDGLKSEVIGPGDAVRVYFDTSIDCVQKLWNGSPQVTATVPDGTPVALVATACKDSWGGSMSVKSSQQHTSPTLWADLKLPTDAALAGKTLTVTVTMPVRYPTMGGGNVFVDGATTATLTRELKLSSAGAGHTYWLTFWAMVGGSVLLAVAGVMLSRGAAALKAAAPDTRVTPIRDTDEESADYRRRGDDDEDEGDRPRRRRAADDDDGGEWKK